MAGFLPLPSGVSANKITVKARDRGASKDDTRCKVVSSGGLGGIELNRAVISRPSQGEGRQALLWKSLPQTRPQVNSRRLKGKQRQSMGRVGFRIITLSIGARLPDDYQMGGTSLPGAPLDPTARGRKQEATSICLVSQARRRAEHSVDDSNSTGLNGKDLLKDGRAV